MKVEDLARAHLEAALLAALHEKADALQLNRNALRDLAGRAIREGAFALDTKGDLDARLGEPLTQWAIRTAADAPHFRKPIDDRSHRPSPLKPGGKVSRMDSKGHRRSASELLEIANAGAAR